MTINPAFHPRGSPCSREYSSAQLTSIGLARPLERPSGAIREMPEWVFTSPASDGNNVSFKRISAGRVISFAAPASIFPSQRAYLFFGFLKIHCPYEERCRAGRDTRDSPGQQRLRHLCRQRTEGLCHSG